METLYTSVVIGCGSVCHYVIVAAQCASDICGLGRDDVGQTDSESDVTHRPSVDSMCKRQHMR